MHSSSCAPDLPLDLFASDIPLMFFPFYLFIWLIQFIVYYVLFVFCFFKKQMIVIINHESLNQESPTNKKNYRK